jgi:nucleotide-binding universal stress UspA family protein
MPPPAAAGDDCGIDSDRKDSMDDRPVLICYDDTPSSRRAIEVAADVLGPGRAVVLDVGPVVTAAESVALTSSALPGGAFEELNRAGALEGARAGAVRAREAGFDAEPSAELGAPTWEAIVDRAEEVDAALIVMGTRGLTGIKELAEGSVSHQVAQHSGRPVLIVPADERH